MALIQEGRIIAGKYRLERTLARGGMGSVWVARHVQLDMLVAIKFMDAGATSSDDARARFEREAKAAAQIQSPHVVQVHDYGIEESTPYIVMELLQGEDLGARLRREKRLPLHEVAVILSQVAKALRKAHDAGLIHRDLKPANIFLARSDEDDEIVKVLDFGVVKVAGGDVSKESTQTGVVVGSVHYMSPEQARGSRDIDYRSDIWSLGVLAFRAIAGQHPFPGEQLGDVIVKVCSEPIPKPSDFAPDLRPEVDAFFVRALARSPADRFPSARDFANELALLAGTAPVGGTGVWPLAPAARGRMPSFGAPPLPRERAQVLREGDPAPPLMPASSPSRVRFGSDNPTLEAGPPQAGVDPAAGTLTEAPRVSDVPFARASNGGPGTKLIAAGAAALTLLIGGFFLMGRDRGEAPAPASSSVSSLEIASATPPPVELPPSAKVESAPAPSASATTSAKPRSGTPARPPKGPPPTQKKVNSTLGI